MSKFYHGTEDIRRHKKSRSLQRNFISGGCEEEEDDDDERIAEENKHLINDTVTIEKDSEENILQHGIKRSRDEYELEKNLDVDDYDLIEENLGQPTNDQPIVKKLRSKKYERSLQQARDIFALDFIYYDEGNNYGDKGDSDGEDGDHWKADMNMCTKLERCHLTSLDNEIRNNDIPERFQLRNTPVTQCSENEIKVEAQWIYKNLYMMDMITKQENLNSIGHGPIGGRKPETVLVSIVEVLHFIRNNLLEVPFIAFYRKEYYTPHLTINDLWLIYQWDEKWTQLQQQKQNLLKTIENMQSYQQALVRKNHKRPLHKNFRRINEMDIRQVESVESFDEFRDCYLYFDLYYSSHIIEMTKNMNAQKQEERKGQKNLQVRELTQEGDDLNQEKPPEAAIEDDNFMTFSGKRNIYSICQEPGISRMASKFGLTSEQFGENLSEGYQRYVIEQHVLDPIEAAGEHVSKRFDTPEKVLHAAVLMVGRQLSCDPAVRKTVRQVFYERAKVSARPTKKGIREIDESHYCYSLKYLKKMPISSFLNDQFLLLNLAKNEGLVEVTIFIDEDPFTRSGIKQKSSYLDEIKHLYHRDEFSSNVQKWNAERTKALEIALTRFLYPYFIKDITAKVLYEAKFAILQLCGKRLNSYISCAPFSFNAKEYRVKDEKEFHTKDGVRILGLAFDPKNEVASFAAIIDGNGETTDHTCYIKLKFLMPKHGESFANELDRSSQFKNWEKLKKFIYEKKPHAIAIGCDGIRTRDVMDKCLSIVKELHENDQFPLIPVEYVDSELSIVFMNSKKACREFPNYPPKLRQAISLARRLQDPLVEFSQLCSPDEEILRLKFHPLQDNVSREELLNIITNEFVFRVNEVGVDINRCLLHTHTQSLVQFIGGLGPRKGNYLLRTLKKQQTPILENRSQLIQNCHIGKVVFTNCAGFIRIDTKTLADSGTDTNMEMLDGTRVHPEAYVLARKMAIDALDENGSNPAQSLAEIIDNPEKLRDLDLDEFANVLKRHGMGLKKQSLNDICIELTDRYQDKRKAYVRPSVEEIFRMLTGETEDTLRVGKMVLVRITGIVRRSPKCLGKAIGVSGKLDNGLSAFIPLKFLSNKEVTDPMTRVQVGMLIHGRILKVIFDRYTVELTCRSSDLADSSGLYKPKKNANYDFEAQKNDFQKEEDTQKSTSFQRTYMKRITVHPSFHNIDFQKAEKLLSQAAQGDTIIRPSSKSHDHLTLSWKVHGGIHQHVDIREENKLTAFSLGRKLFIGKETFEDLDEIISRFVQPMAGLARNFTSFKYFRDLNGDLSAVEALLNEEKQKTPSRIPYIVSASKEFPGKFMLSYQSKTKVFCEYITVTPGGCRLRGKNFKSINDLFNWFKAHFNDYSASISH